MEDELKNEYEVSRSDRGRDVLTIHRKPSQVPVHVDRTLSHLGCMVSMDGPNSRMDYEFYFPDGLKKAEEYLTRCDWVRKS